MTNRIYLTVILFLTSLMSYAGGEEKTRLEYVITQNEVDNSLSKTEALFVFTFKIDPEGTLVQQVIKGGCNGVEKNILPNSEGKSSLKIIPGKYFFQFFFTNDYFEIQTDSIAIEPGHRIEITVNFQSSLYPIIMEKPVIYCYPKENTNVHIDLGLKGDMLFTYPTYKNGWDFTAEPNGTIHTNGKQFKYLFWEGETKINYSTTKFSEGSVVKKDELLSFLEASLTQMGMTSGEQQDFITYWFPLMQKNEKNYIHFVFNEDYSQYASMNIQPKPDNMLRVYMLWADASQVKEYDLHKQEIPTLKRGGFTLVEWGGSQMETFPELIN